MNRRYLFAIGEGIIVIFIAFISSLYTLFPFCFIYQNADFDSQNLLTWEYTAVKKIPLYKSIFYPYGIFSYLQNTNIVIHYGHILVYFLLLLVTLISLKKMWNNISYAYISFAVFIFFIIKFTGIEAFIRYGILFGFCLLVGFIEQTKRQKFFTFLLGTLTGIIFSLIPDQGFYCFVVFYLFLIFLPVFINGFQVLKQKNFIFSIGKRGVLFTFGSFSGLAPFLIFLIQKHLFINFLENYHYISELPIIAKTPFIPSLRTHENLFTLGVLILTVIHLSYTYLFTTKKKSFKLTRQLLLFIALILLEQKNIIRSIDSQVTFFALFLLLLLLSEYILKIELRVKNRIVPLFLFTGFFICLLFFSGFRPFFPFGIGYYAASQSTCIDKNISTMIAKDPEYKKVKETLEKQTDFNGRIFSFPGDPVFYILFNQKPPYYFTLYEATSKLNQKTNIDYIENQHIRYVIYNTKINAIQNGVPDYIRGTFTLRYILSHFVPVEKIGKYIILRKTANENDIFHDSSDFSENLTKQFTHINLSTIPEEEGNYKNKYIPKNMRVFSTLKELNNYLSQSSVNSKNEFIIIQFKKNVQYTNIKVITSEGLETMVGFYSDKKNIPYIINLQNIPLFYRPRIIKKIELYNPSLNFIQLLQIKKINFFW